MRIARASFVALLLVAFGCGEDVQYEFSYELSAGSVAGVSSLGGTITSSAAGVSSGGAALAGEAGTPSHGDGGDLGEAGRGGAVGGEGGQFEGAGGAAGTPGDGGAAGMSQAAGSSGAGSAGTAGARACVSVTECPRPANACLTARCAAGTCVTDNVPSGALFVLDAPADCHATTACDGLGHPTLVVAQDNAPTPNNPCLAGTCNASGAVGTEPLPRGARCGFELGGDGKCDGTGNCVVCLSTADCPLGQSCSASHACVGQPCTDLNCGGACPACIGQKCATGRDCASHTCDPATLLCALDPQCADQRQDGNETDRDCGGGVCPGCGLGKACLIGADCASFACDVTSHTCVADACFDHRMDGGESDVDCGGGSMVCDRCGVGQKCNDNWDCIAGHFCNGVKVCQ